MIQISTPFEGGSIEVVKADTPEDIKLRLRADLGSNFRQWFFFKVETEAWVPLRITLLDVHRASYPKGWKDYNMLASYDRESWFRIPSTFDGKHLMVKHTPQTTPLFLAYTTPYTWQRHLQLICRAESSPHCRVTTVATSSQGRPIHLYTIGKEHSGKRVCWFIGRQHSGETMAEWCLEGVIESLLDESELSTQLRQKALFSIIPNMNPDGAALGNQRLSAIGTDLNRSWLQPSLDKSPEVLGVRQKIEETGVDFFLDAHGDEELPYVFLATHPMTDRLARLQEDYRQALLAATPEFQTEHGYVIDPTRPINLQVAINFIAKTFDCLSFTLEMPFSDNLKQPNPEKGWSAKRSKELGKNLLQALVSIVEKLREPR